MANRTPQHVLLLALLVWRPVAVQLQAGGPRGGALVQIAGHAKCGTSHLHSILASHSAIFSLRKEQCPDKVPVAEDVFAQMLNFTAALAQPKDGVWPRLGYKKVRQACAETFGPSAKEACWSFYEDALSGGSDAATRVLQSCIWPQDVMRVQSLAPVAKTSVLFLQRDPADLLWSSYNFWQGPMDADETRNGSRVAGWTNQQNYRSPAHFHELVASKGMLAGGVSNWRAYFQIPEMHQLRATFGSDSMLFVRSEDLHKRSTVQDICDFIGVGIEGISPDLVGARTNGQGSYDSRGIGHQSEAEPGIYEASGFRPMLCETRELIYGQSRDACSELHREFGLHYPQCLGEAPACATGPPPAR